MSGRTRTFDPDFKLPRNPAPPKQPEIPNSYKNFSVGWHLLLLMVFLFSFVPAFNIAHDNPSLSLLPFLPIFLFILVLARIVRGSLYNYRIGWHQQSNVEFKKEIARYQKNLESLSGEAFVDSQNLDPQDRPRLVQVQLSVDYILTSEIHKSGQVLDTTRNQVVLRDLEWQIAKDLLRATRAEQKLQSIGRPQSDHLQAKDSYEQAQKALENLRSEATERVAKIAEYANQVRHAQNLLDDDNRVDDYNDVFTELQIETAAGTQQDVSLKSLIEAQKVGLEVVEMHTKLGL